MATLGDIEAIFRRQRWSYGVEGGLVVAHVEGVPLVIGAESNGARVGTIVFRGRVTAVRAAELQTFLNAVNQAQPRGYLEYDRGRDTIFFWTVVTLTGGSADDRRLTEAIILAVLAAKGVGPIVADVASGRITLNQALAKIRGSGGQAA
jgi:hypothetical protein